MEHGPVQRQTVCVGNMCRWPLQFRQITLQPQLAIRILIVVMWEISSPHRISQARLCMLKCLLPLVIMAVYTQVCGGRA